MEMTVNLVLLLDWCCVAAGFVHTAFSFANESLVTKSPVAQLDIPPGALITFLQKGLEYVGIEEHITAVRALCSVFCGLLCCCAFC